MMRCWTFLLLCLSLQIKKGNGLTNQGISILSSSDVSDLNLVHGFGRGASPASPYCTIADQVCNPRQYRLEDSVLEGGDTFQDKVEACSQACNTNDECNFFSLHKRRTKHYCTLLTKCEARYDDVCISKGLCKSGPKPELCEGKDVVEPTSCSAPASYEPPYIPWQCIHTMVDISPKDTSMPPGTECYLRCPSWVDRDYAPATLYSLCQDNGEWTATSPTSGDAELHFPLGPYPQPDSTSDSGLAMQCTCPPVYLLWPPKPSNMEQDPKITDLNFMHFLPSGDYTKLTYDPNSLLGASFTCDRDYKGIGPGGIHALPGNAKCSLYCDKDLFLIFGCINGKWTGSPKEGVYCFKEPAIDGDWSHWGHWSFNTTAGLKVRERECNSPPVQNEGDVCEGEELETENSRVCKRIVVRKNVNSLTQAEKTALEAMLFEMKTSSNITTNFETLGQIHGLPYMCNLNQTGLSGGPGDENGCCIQHWGQQNRVDDFVTWHRLYVYNFEMSLFGSDDTTTLGVPYWDWTSSTTDKMQLPGLALKEPWLNGPIKGGRLYMDYCTGDNITTCRSTLNCEGENLSPDCYVTTFQKRVKLAFQQKIWVNFNAQINMPHGSIHDFVGGDMATIEYSSYDPIFFLHHSNVDRQFAYYEELQKIRNRELSKYDFCVNTQTFLMFPFAAEENRVLQWNPYLLSKEQSTGPETFDTLDSFCYEFDSLEFMGMTPQQFIEQEELEKQHAKLFIGMIVPHKGESSSLKFDLQGPDGLSIPGVGIIETFGSAAPPGTHPPGAYMLTSPNLMYVEIDLDEHKAIHDTVDFFGREIRFSVSDYRTITGTARSLDETTKPVVAVKVAGSNKLHYRLHSAYAHEYHDEIRFLPGSKIEVVSPDGSLGPFDEYIGDSSLTHQDGELHIQFEDHLVEMGGVNITVGHQTLYKCENGSPACNPSSQNDGVVVIPWDTNASSLGTVTFYVTDAENVYVLLAWCEGMANVHRFKTKEEFDNCEGLSEDGAREGPNSYNLDVEDAGVYYLANGVGDACNQGWKLEVVVLSSRCYDTMSDDDCESNQ